MTTYLTEKASNLSIPTFFMRFNGKIENKDFVKLLSDVFPKWSRFRSLVEGKSFIEMQDFDCNMCVYYHDIGTENGKDSLAGFISSIMNTPMDFSKPLWEAHLLQDLDGKDTCVVFRVHHCIADGMSLGAVLMSLR
jgi:diacylglycerol O-acyltransferase